MIMVLNDTFVDNVVFLRKHYTVSQRAMAKLIGMSYLTYRDYEEKRIRPDLPPEPYHRLCQVLGIDGNTLYHFELWKHPELIKPCREI